MNFTVQSDAGGLEIDRVIDAAARTLSNQRCQEAYRHDLRGGLHALASSLELLSRIAQKGAAEPTAVEKASALAKRALMSHEQSLHEMLDRLVAADTEPTVVNVASLVEDAARFLRADAANRDVRMTISGDSDLQTSITPNRLRGLLLDLMTLAIDRSPPGAELQLAISRAAEYACVEMRSPLLLTAEDCGDPALTLAKGKFSRAQVLVAGARHWLPKLGGRLEIGPGIGTTGVVRIYCPLSSG